MQRELTKDGTSAIPTYIDSYRTFWLNSQVKSAKQVMIKLLKAGNSSNSRGKDKRVTKMIKDSGENDTNVPKKGETMG